MQCVSAYESPLGDIVLAADDVGLTGLWLEGQPKPDLVDAVEADGLECESLAIQEAKRWLDAYFQGGSPNFTPPLHVQGTAFQLRVWDLLRSIPYGETVTYGRIAKCIAAEDGGAMSSQAVGGAVGRNPVSIIVPCHRVVGANGNLTGYAGGLDKKIALLQLEGVDMTRFHDPRARTRKA